jgi:hypothetical protein
MRSDMMDFHPPSLFHRKHSVLMPASFVQEVVS